MRTNKFKKPKSDFGENLDHRGCNRLSRQGAEFLHKLHEVGKRPTPGFRGRKS